MTILRSLSIGAYVAATQPYRAWARAHYARRSQLPVAALFFHRVADDYPNGWTMSLGQFDRHIRWLQKNCDLISLAELQRRMREGNDQRVAVSITFDDGYADNCLHAIPTLLSRRIPFTYFVTTQNVRYGKPFAHDLKAGQPLAPNSIDEIKAMADAGVEIGVHTRTHADLGQVSRSEDLDDEILGARDEIERWTGRKPRYFAFPYGLPRNLNPQAIQLLHDAGFDGFCSAYGGYNVPHQDAFHVQRFHADPDVARVRNWLTLDPRWLLRRRPFEYNLIDNRDSPSPSVRLATGEAQ